jgi:hypothetical protein
VRANADTAHDAAVARETPVRWDARILERPPDWYASAEARAVADSVLRHQSREGAWPKNTDLSRPPSPADATAATEADLRLNTIDNDATTLPMQFLARVAQATSEAAYRAAWTTCLPPSTPTEAGRSTSRCATGTTRTSRTTTTPW